MKLATRLSQPGLRAARARVVRPPITYFSRYYAGVRDSAATPTKSKRVSRWFWQGIAFGLAGGLTFGILDQIGKYQPRAQADAPSSFSNDSIELQPPTDMPPFPAQISINKVPYAAIGTGVRTVTFLNFHVYAVGLYIASEDVPLARRILRNAARNHGVQSPVDLATLLATPDRGAAIVDELLRENVRFAVRIVPTRTTDFGHLRAGFVRSITNHKEAKALESPEFGQSIGEIKKAFGSKRKLQKGQVITWARDVTGGMTAWYGPSDEEKELLGSLPNADVARLFFLQYMTGPKPNSPTLKDHAVTGLALVAA